VQINSALCQERGGGRGREERDTKERAVAQKRKGTGSPPTFKGVNTSVFGGGEDKGEKGIGLEIKAKLERSTLSLGHPYSRKKRGRW